MKRTLIAIGLTIALTTGANATMLGMKTVSREIVACAGWDSVDLVQKMHNVSPLSSNQLSAAKCRAIPSGTQVIMVEDGISADKISTLTGGVYWVDSGVLN